MGWSLKKPCLHDIVMDIWWYRQWLVSVVKKSLSLLSQKQNENQSRDIPGFVTKIEVKNIEYKIAMPK